MGTKAIPDGIYTVMGPGGQLGMPAPGSLLLLPPEDAPPQRWNVMSGSDGYTLRDIATGSYLGTDGDPNDVVMVLNGTPKPFAWQLSDGPDHDPNSYVLTSAASSDGLVLAPSLLRIYPPRVAIMPSRGDYNVEWTFAQVGLSAPGPIRPWLGGNYHVRTNQAADRRGPARERADHLGGRAEGSLGRHRPKAR